MVLLFVCLPLHCSRSVGHALSSVHKLACVHRRFSLHGFWCSWFWVSAHAALAYATRRFPRGRSLHRKTVSPCAAWRNADLAPHRPPLHSAPINHCPHELKSLCAAPTPSAVRVTHRILAIWEESSGNTLPLVTPTTSVCT